ncbi:Alpha/Beta hydrolase protein [Ilyonectria destructans]|nr:Alpha/Beta hydrolase protein [Ilyonectria destructans]
MQGTFLRLLGATVVVWASGTTARHDVHIRDSSDATGGPVIKLGYATYEGYYDDTYDLNIWKGIRYAAPPIGKLRWQAPQAVETPKSRPPVTGAVDQPPKCPQSGAFGTPEVYGFNSGPGDEDCLYLNVYAAPDASDLPVLVWIHGGGYQLFGATYDPSVWMNTNSNGFIVVEIQYRLGAFGFLSSKAVKKKGKLNAGLLDQEFALVWVQKHISKFGGDPDRVTIAGESSGAGSVMHHALAYGGKDSKLFTNVIAASPYAPPIYCYDETVPTGHYAAFVKVAGCGKGSPARKKHGNAFDCLVAADSAVLQNASGTVSTTRGYFGSFSWLPVIDGDFIQGRPSRQLHLGRVSGKHLLVGNNANEGVPLTNPAVETQTQYDDFVTNTFPLFSNADTARLHETYQLDQAQPGDDDARFDTLGDGGPTALNQSSYATGIQQAVFNMAGESTFDCPAQWFAEAYSTDSRKVWKYQYSVSPSHHGADLSAYFAVGAEVPNADFRHALQKIWGNFVISNSPIISVADVTAGYKNATVPKRGNKIRWPEYSLKNPQHMDLNTTGGEVTLVPVTDELSFYVRSGVGIVNNFRLANGWTWEGGRGARCAFWRAVSAKVPY